MSDISVPLAAVPGQSLSVVLANQNAEILIYMLGSRLYFDLSVDSSPVVTAVQCQDRVKLVREAYLGFSGDLVFVDTQGTSDPTYDGLGDRYQLVYLP